LAQPLADCQPEPRPAVTPRRRAVRLRERVEHLAEPAGGNPDACVAHREPQLDARAVRPPRPDRDGDLAFVGELHGVVNEVDDYLPAPHRVPRHGCRDGRLESVCEVEPLPARGKREQVERLLDAPAQVEGSALQVELARLYLREVEYVVD